MPQLLVQKKLNKRSEIPATLPQDKGIVDTVPQGHVFWGELVRDKNIHLPSPPLDKWYRDEKGFYYWGGALDVISSSEVRLVSKQWWQQYLQLDVLQSILLPFVTNSNPVNIAILDSGLADGDDISGAFSMIGKRNFISDTENIIDSDSGHGTLCASLICGRNQFFKGVNPKANIFIGKIADNGFSNGFFLTKALNHICSHSGTLPIDIISYSGGVPGSDNTEELQLAIQNAIGKQMIVISAIGNKFQAPSGLYPALYDDVISVGALDQNGDFSIELNPSIPKIDFLVPGEDIHSINVLRCKDEFDGTSHACAIMAGIVSLVLAKVKQKKLNWDSNKIRTFLQECSDQHPIGGEAIAFKVNSIKLLAKIKKI